MCQEKPDTIAQLTASNVVVIVHAAQTATSKPKRLGIITDSERKLITHEISDRGSIDCVCVFMDNCSKLPTSLKEEG